MKKYRVTWYNKTGGRVIGGEMTVEAANAKEARLEFEDRYYDPGFGGKKPHPFDVRVRLIREQTGNDGR